MKGRTDEEQLPSDWELTVSIINELTALARDFSMHESADGNFKAKSGGGGQLSIAEVENKLANSVLTVQLEADSTKKDIISENATLQATFENHELFAFENVALRLWDTDNSNEADSIRVNTRVNKNNFLEPFNIKSPQNLSPRQIYLLNNYPFAALQKVFLPLMKRFGHRAQEISHHHLCELTGPLIEHAVHMLGDSMQKVGDFAPSTQFVELIEANHALITDINKQLQTEKGELLAIEGNGDKKEIRRQSKLVQLIEKVLNDPGLSLIEKAEQTASLISKAKQKAFSSKKKGRRNIKPPGSAPHNKKPSFFSGVVSLFQRRSKTEPSLARRNSMEEIPPENKSMEEAPLANTNKSSGFKQTPPLTRQNSLGGDFEEESTVDSGVSFSSDDGTVMTLDAEDFGEHSSINDGNHPFPDALFSEVGRFDRDTHAELFALLDEHADDIIQDIRERHEPITAIDIYEIAESRSIEELGLSLQNIGINLEDSGENKLRLFTIVDNNISKGSVTPDELLKPSDDLGKSRGFKNE